MARTHPCCLHQTLQVAELKRLPLKGHFKKFTSGQDLFVIQIVKSLMLKYLQMPHGVCVCGGEPSSFQFILLHTERPVYFIQSDLCFVFLFSHRCSLISHQILH